MKKSTCVTFAHECTKNYAPSSAAALRNIQKANDFADSMRDVFLELAYERKFRISDVVVELNRLGIPSFRDCKWHRTTVMRMFERLGKDFEAERRAAYNKREADLQTKIFGKPLDISDLEKLAANYKKSK